MGEKYRITKANGLNRCGNNKKHTLSRKTGAECCLQKWVYVGVNSGYPYNHAYDKIAYDTLMQARWGKLGKSATDKRRGSCGSREG